MIRLVLDTNIVVSAMLARFGNEALVLRLARAGRFLTCISPPILDEYELVLRRPAFRVPLASLEALFAWLRADALLVVPPFAVHASPDDPDNRFLECAEAARADFLLTGNRRHFPPQWKGTRIASAREFLESFSF